MVTLGNITSEIYVGGYRGLVPGNDRVSDEGDGNVETHTDQDSPDHLDQQLLLHGNILEPMDG